MSKEDIGRTDLSMIPGQSQQQLQQGQQQGYDPYDGYYDPYAGSKPHGLNEKMFQMVIKAELPSDVEDYEGFFQALIDAASANPNVTERVIRRWNRRFKDVDDRAHSQGRSKIAAAKARKLLFEIRSYIARGDNPLQGMSGVSAAITTRQQSESTVKVPQQQDAGTGSFGVRWPWGRR